MSAFGVAARTSPGDFLPAQKNSLMVKNYPRREVMSSIRGDAMGTTLVHDHPDATLALPNADALEPQTPANLWGIRLTGIAPIGISIWVLGVLENPSLSHRFAGGR